MRQPFKSASMLHYRLCIYTSNFVLGGTFVFFALSVALGLADVRLSFLGEVRWSHPTFLYAYIALFLQFALLQTIGWLGSWRLSPKLLRAYWILLLLLTICDVIAGVLWVYKLDKVKLSFQRAVLQQFKEKYSVDLSFTSAWDTMQSQELCCGVHSPQDFSNILNSRSMAPSGPLHSHDGRILLPQSCCYFVNKRENKSLHLELTVAAVSAVNPNIDSQTTNRFIQHPRRPKPHGTISQSAINGIIMYESMSRSGLNLVQPPHLQFPRRSWRKAGSPTATTTTTTTTAAPSDLPFQWICPLLSTEEQSNLNRTEKEETGKYFHVHSHGCEIKFMEWLEDFIELMFKYFCIICFIEVCCLVILHYAIREMIIAKKIISGPTSHRSCRYHNPTTDPSLTEEMKQIVGEKFAGTDMNSSSSEDDDRDRGKQYNLWLTNNGDDGESLEAINLTVSMGKVSRFNGQRMLTYGRRPWTEPCTSHFSQHDQHYEPQHYMLKGIPNKNVSMASQKIAPELLMGEHKNLSPPVHSERIFEQQQPSMDEIDHVSVSFNTEDGREKNCNVWLCCAYTE